MNPQFFFLVCMTLAAEAEQQLTTFWEKCGSICVAIEANFPDQYTQLVAAAQANDDKAAVTVLNALLKLPNKEAVVAAKPNPV